MVETVYLAGVIALIGMGVGLLLRNEIRAARADMRETRRLMERIRDELVGLHYLFIQQESDRVRKEARAARERLAASREGRTDADARIDIALVVDASRPTVVDPERDSRLD